MITISIQSLHEADFDTFEAYLNDQLSDNGAEGTGYFHPQPRELACFEVARAQAFRKGLGTSIDAPSWRRAWVARNAAQQIMGHVDLRALPEPYALHRCLLGMGVHRSQRRQGLGLALLDAAQSWAVNAASLEWMDLQVLSENQAAIRLYTRFGFMQVGEIPDIFRFDGRTFSYTTMTKKL